MFHNHIAQLQYYCFIYFNFQILREKSRRQDNVSQPYSTTDSIAVLNILIFKFLERSLEDKTMFHNQIAQLQYYCFIYFNFQILREKSRRQDHASQPYSTTAILLFYIF